MKLIDKDALVAEIERLWNEYKNNDEDSKLTWFVAKLENFVNTLEVKEVDLKKEIENYLSSYWSNEKELHPFLGHIEKCFFELGLKAQKGE